MTKITIQALADYVEDSANLAESIIKDITDNDGAISEETVLALNEFMKSAETIVNFTSDLQLSKSKLDS